MKLAVFAEKGQSVARKHTRSEVLEEIAAVQLTHVGVTLEKLIGDVRGEIAVVSLECPRESVAEPVSANALYSLDLADTRD